MLYVLIALTFVIFTLFGVGGITLSEFRIFMLNVLANMFGGVFTSIIIFINMRD